MQRKSESIDLDVPKNDQECWDRYPKHRWVYELSRLLDAQNIKWSPFADSSFPDKEMNLKLKSPSLYQTGYIYLRKPDGQHMITEIHITKGEIKNMRHFDPVTDIELDTLIGEIELRINAFVTLHFQKFTGVVSIDTYANEILRMRLRPHHDPSAEANSDIAKLVKRIYKKSDTTLNGPSDRILHESLAS